MPSPRLTRAERREYERLFADVQPPKSREILIGALAAFAHRGFHAATTRDIAEFAQLSPAGVYVHYRSKDELLLALILAGHDVMLDATRAAIAAGPDDPAACVRRYVEAWTEGHARLHTLARVAQYEFAALSPAQVEPAVAARGELVALLEEHVRRGVADGTFDAPDPHGTVRAIMSLGIDVARWYGIRREPPPQAIARQYGELALRMLAVSPRT